MRLRVALAVFVVLCINVFSANEVFKDITRDHWAYRYVENLVYKGIIPKDTANFNGEESISRYEMAEYLSKVLNKLDDEKASQEDLRILEKLVYEFSKELNNSGMNIDQYVSKLKKIEEDRDIVEKRQKELEEKLVKIEKQINSNNSLTEKGNENSTKIAGKVENIELYLKSSMYTKGSDFSKMNLSKEYTAGITIKQSYGELTIKYDTIAEKAYIEGEYNREIFKGINLHINTPGYNRDIYSYYDNLQYRSLCKNWETGFEHSIIKVLLEKEDEMDSASLISKADYKYFNMMTFYNSEEKDFDYEAAGIYPFMGKFKVSAGYGKDGDFSYINGRAEYKNKEVMLLTAGYERKDNRVEKKQLFNMVNAKANYNISESFKTAVKVEFLDTVPGTFFNYGILLKDKIAGLDLSLSFDKKKIEKESIYDIDYITAVKENKEEITLFKIKGLYNLGEKIKLNAGYARRDQVTAGNWLILFGAKYYVYKDVMMFSDFVRSKNLYIDTERDINGDNFDIDNDDKNFVIGDNNSGYEKGRLRIGFELKF